MFASLKTIGINQSPCYESLKNFFVYDKVLHQRLQRAMVLVEGKIPEEPEKSRA